MAASFLGSNWQSCVSQSTKASVGRSALQQLSLPVRTRKWVLDFIQQEVFIMNDNCCGRSSSYGLCPRCHKLRELTKHHILPKRRFPAGRNSPLLHLCRVCHDVIDDLTFLWEEMERSYIIEQTVRWLKGEHDEYLSSLRTRGNAYVPCDQFT